jgi:hypothetical protein
MVRASHPPTTTTCTCSSAQHCSNPTARARHHDHWLLPSHQEYTRCGMVGPESCASSTPAKPPSAASARNLTRKQGALGGVVVCVCVCVCQCQCIRTARLRDTHTHTHTRTHQRRGTCAPHAPAAAAPLHAAHAPPADQALALLRVVAQPHEQRLEQPVALGERELLPASDQREARLAGGVVMVRM